MNTRLPARLCLLLLALLLSAAALALPREEVPEPLQPWVDWVLYDHPDRACPFLFNSAEYFCLWPGTLSLQVDSEGAEFSQTLTLYRQGYFPLPGNREHWPQELQANGEPLVVLSQSDGTPVGHLPAGEYSIEGVIRWQQMPRTLQVSEYTGRVELALNGEPVRQVRFEGPQQLILGESTEAVGETPQNTLSVRVYRQINDTIPQQITTEVQLDISGSERELLLGQLLPEGFVPWQFDSPLPARLEADGQVRVQLKPGRWQIRLRSYSLAPPDTLGFSQTTEHWPDSEIWVFRASPDYRTVELEGAPGIDAAQTSLPDDWRQYPAYLLTPETPLTLVEQYRAPSHFGEHELQLNKTLWLDFNGAGFTVRDTITGTLKGHARLETLAPYQLGSATSHGEPLLVTQLEDRDHAGIEVRGRNAQLMALSRLPRHYSLPVGGWQTDFASVNTTLHMPPGWSLLAASGADRVSGAWLDNWNLWDIFLVLFISVALGRGGRWPLGLVALVTLLLIYQRPGAPLFIWLNLAACLALAKVVTERWQKPLRNYTLASFALLALFYLPFATQQARLAIYPQLEHPGVYVQAARPQARTREPSDSQMLHDESDTILEEVVVTGIRASDLFEQEEPEPPRGLSRPTPKSVPLSQSYGPNQQIQAGPAEQQWQWNRASLNWSGPVKAQQHTRFLLVPPLLNRLGYLLAVLMPLVLVLLLWRQLQLPLPSLPRRSHAASSALVLMAALLVLPSGETQASVTIDPELLEELEERLTQPADCLPGCANIESVDLQLANDRLALTLRVHAKEFIALPLPVERSQWQPQWVQLNGVPATLSRNNRGQLLVALPEGVHRLELQGSLAGLQQVNLPFGLSINNLRSAVDGWQLSGAPRGQTRSRDLRLERILSAEATAQETLLQPTEIPAFVQVSRTLNLGLEWTLETRVRRLAPARGAINLDIPLLPGEAPLSGEVTDQHTMPVALAPDQSEYTWSSVISPTSELTQQAADEAPWIELWQVNATPVWHVQTDSNATLAADRQIPLWRPRPGDSLSLQVSRPDAVAGEALTISHAALRQQSGARGQTVTLGLDIKTYQGGHFDFSLPEDAELTQLSINGRTQPLVKTRGDLRIPVTPGEQAVELAWRTPEPLGILTKTPALELGHKVGNIGLVLNLPHNRWTLLTGGPTLGPAVLIWGVLLVVLLVAIGLGRSRLTPLRTWEWVLLSLGIVTMSAFLLALAALWFIALSLRGQQQPEVLGRFFNAAQVLLMLLSLIALAILISAIPYGLLANPAMLVTGNGSSTYYLNWYLDQSDGDLPVGWVISLPIWVYRIAMLFWSLWLAFALTRWLPWAWRQLGANGWWRRRSTNMASSETP